MQLLLAGGCEVLRVDVGSRQPWLPCLIFTVPPPPGPWDPHPPAQLQVQSNALAALEAVDEAIAERVYEEGCITGDRVNGLCDGITGDW